MAQRLRLYEISAFALLTHLQTGNAARIEDGIPPGAEIRRGGYDTERDVFYLTVEHDSFDPVEEVEPIPTGEVIATDIREEE